MARTRFHRQPFDEGTLTKLEIFQLYARAWLPVFLSKPGWQAIHVFDFFAGPGTDSRRRAGSPLRLLEEIRKARRPAAGSGPRLHLHLFDALADNVAELRQTVAPLAAAVRDLDPPDIKQLKFHDALTQYAQILNDPSAAKLLLIDQFGVDEVLAGVFRHLVAFPRSDFLFFISSSTLNRFRNHPAIKQRIERPDDSYHVHRAVLAYYRRLLPNPESYWLAPFSIKKGANIYGVIFGSAHPLGMDKFLEVAWKQDRINGEANFDINRDNIVAGQLSLFGEQRPTKLLAFEDELRSRIRSGVVRNELDVIRICFDHGVRPSHAAPVLAALKQEGVIRCDFRVPSMRRRKSPKPIELAEGPSAKPERPR